MWRDWLKSYPFVALLSLQIVVILCLSQSHRLVTLVSGTDVDWLDSVRVMSVWVEHEPSERAKTMLVETSVVSVIDSAGSRESRGRLRLYIRKDSLARSVTQGDILLVRCCPKRPEVSLDGFDYGRYLQMQGIAATAFVDSAAWCKTAHRTIHKPSAWAERVRAVLLRRLSKAGLSKRNESIVAALTLGFRDNIDQETRSAFAASGAMHVLAVSGLHVGIICSVLLVLLTFSTKLRMAWKDSRLKLCYIIIVLVLWFYACLTGLTPSVTRATLMCTLGIAALFITRQVSVFNVIAASAFLSLCVNPLALMSVSFQLSYSAVVSIVTIGQRLMGLVRIRSKAVKWVYDLAAVSVAAQLGTMPWTLFYFGFVSNFFLMTNFVVITAAYVLVCLTAFVLLFGGVPVLGVWSAKALDTVTTAVFSVLQHIEHWDGAVTVCRFTLPMSLLLLAAIICGYMMLTRRKLLLALPVGACLAAIVVLFAADTRQRLQHDELRVERSVVRVAGETQETLSADSTMSVFRWNGRDYVWVAGEELHGMQANKPLRCNYLLTGQLGRTQPDELLQCVSADTVWITAATSRYKAEKIKAYCNLNTIPVIEGRTIQTIQ